MTHNQLAELCQQSYAKKDFVINECEVLVTYQKNVQIVVFRGTEAGALFSGAGWLDVVRDLRLCPWYDADANWCHAGYLKGGRSAADFLADCLVMDLPVICTGHSMGGALALMCAVRLQSMGFTVQEWVGFGSPKVQLTKKRYDFRQTNYRHRGDIVPLMPRKILYKISGWLFTLSQHPLLYRLCTWLENKEFYRHNCLVIWLKPKLGLTPNWSDHIIEHYVRTVG